MKTLSDERYRCFADGIWNYPEEKVKEFIKELKGIMIEVKKLSLKNKDLSSGAKLISAKHVNRTIEIIDKLAGEKLI